MMRLLCVEDEVSLREDIAEYLRMKSYEVDEAETGEDAIHRLHDKHYDLVLCDIKMPKMDGYELLRQVRSENQHVKTPFVFLSALGERDDRIRAHEIGCDGFLTKPIDFSVLDATLRAHIERQRARDFQDASMIECGRRHIMTAIDDALNGPITNAAVTIQHLRDTLPTLTPSALDSYLKQAEEDIFGHALKLHMFHSAVQLQLSQSQLEIEDKLFNMLLSEAMQECKYLFPASPIRYIPAPSNPVVRCDARMLQRAISGLLSAIPHACDTHEVVFCDVSQGHCVLSICDVPQMHEDEGFMRVDPMTDLAALSIVTRQRLVVIAYAIQVAQAHNGWLEIKLWPQGEFAARFQLPQREEANGVH
jgi:DNA-binding response OmpR family regulator